jgi:hypothetical protein
MATELVPTLPVSLVQIEKGNPVPTRRGPKRMTRTHPKVERLIEALTLGDFVEEACQYAGISVDTYYRWIREGNDLNKRDETKQPLTAEEREITELSEAIKEAELKGQHAALATIRRAAKNGTWQAAAWFLERRNKKWSNRTEITGPDGGPVQTVTVEDVDEKIRNLIAASEADRGGVDAPA